MQVIEEGKKLKITFPYNARLVAEVKAMRGARWNPEGKFWTVDNCERNLFNLKYLQGNNVFEPYEKPLIEVQPKRSLYTNQLIALRHALTRKRAVLGAEMGLGKTLVAIELMERVGGRWIYVAPKSALSAVRLELRKWDADVDVELTTYESLKKVSGEYIGIIFDECQKIKTPTAQRSKVAARYAKHAEYVLLMSGTPAPKDPTDWWHITEVACPGFLREGTIQKLRFRLGVFSREEGIAGNTYNRLIAWRDGNVCDKCGKPPEEHTTNHAPHTVDGVMCALCGKPVDIHDADHNYKRSADELSILSKRLEGLVVTQLKKDFTDLPDKVYEEVVLEPTPLQKEFAKYITDTSPRAITALTLLRELSDGFQYIEGEGKEITCPACNGKGTTIGGSADEFGTPVLDGGSTETCRACNGTGKTREVVRDVELCETPKDQYLRDALENHEDVGRIVIFSAFKGSLAKIQRLVELNGWDYITVSGEGVKNSLGEKTLDGCLRRFQSGEGGKIAYIAQPSAGGIGVTLTASPKIIFYSNDFNYESRAQAEDRIHRLGMDINRGARIVDLIVLPSDKLVLDNLKQKKSLMKLTMEDLCCSLNSKQVNGQNANP